MEQTERDLLIELKVGVKNLTDRFDKFETNFNADKQKYDSLQTQVDNMTPIITELSGFKNKFYTAVISAFISVILFLVNIICTYKK